MVAMFLDFIVVISPLISFEIGVCPLMKVFIALIRSWETTPMDNPSKSSREGFGQGDEVKVTNVPSMRFVIFFK
jgi:transcription elongation factor